MLDSFLYVPFDLAFDDANSLYVAEHESNISGVYKVNPYGDVFSFVQLRRPHSIEFDPTE